MARVLLWFAFLVLLALVLLKGVKSAFSVQGDFANYYTAASIVVRGGSLEPAYRDYTYFQKQMDRAGVNGQLGGFIPHPPPTALLFLPLTPLDPVAAKAIWTLVNLALAGLCVWLLCRLAELDWLTVAALFLATGYGLINNLVFGQLYLLLLAAILLGLDLARRDRPLAAGVCLGLLTPVKYVAGFYILYMAWKRNWTLVLAALGTIAAVLAASLTVLGFGPWDTFLGVVLPRHLAGEIQDPFAVRFQSWTSLLRRVLVAEPTLNPEPVADLPVLFMLLKNAGLWTMAGLSSHLIAAAEFPTQSQREWFRLGLIPLAILLASPAGATYHFLLLTVTAVFFVKILLAQGRVSAAVGLGALYAAVNLPHYLYLEDWARGWTTPLAYPRFWLLTAFLATSLILFRPFFRQAGLFSRWIPAIALATAAATTIQWISHSRVPSSAARPLQVFDLAATPRLDYNLTDPDLGLRRLVFVCPEADRQRYGVFAEDATRWTPAAPRNFYNPDLAGNDALLAVETVVDGRTEIWISREKEAEPVFLAVGESPSWSLDGRKIAFSNGGRLWVTDLDSDAKREFPSAGKIGDLSLSPSGAQLAYTTSGSRSELRLVALATGSDRSLLISDDWVGTPSWSASEETLLFSWRQGGNIDVYALDPATGATLRLTRHPGSDHHPVWDARNDRIVFASDRGRGLGFNTLYQLTIPARLR